VPVNRDCSLRFDLDVRDSLHARRRPDALIVQDDRNLVMAPPGTLDPETVVDLEGAARTAAAHRPLSVGTFLVSENTDTPVRWTYRAIVHDFDSSPTCRPGDVRRSVTAILADADRKCLDAVAMEPVGIWNHRGLTPESMVEALDRAVLEAAVRLTRSMRVVLLLDHVDELEAVSNLLRSRVISRATRSFRTVAGDAAVVEIRSLGHRLHVRFVPGTMSGYMITRIARVGGGESAESSSCLDIS
jgi:hypothetical protein